MEINGGSVKQNSVLYDGTPRGLLGEGSQVS